MQSGEKKILEEEKSQDSGNDAIYKSNLYENFSRVYI